MIGANTRFLIGLFYVPILQLVGLCVSILVPYEIFSGTKQTLVTLVSFELYAILFLFGGISRLTERLRIHRG
nr:hypothetical protein [uncultured archaeon]